MNKCVFDTGHSCNALACYSSEKCNGKDAKGNPIYEDIKNSSSNIEKGKNEVE